MGNVTRALVATVMLGCGDDIRVTDAGLGSGDARQPDSGPDIDAAPTYDFSCFGVAQPTTAADPIKFAGVTQTVGMGGPAPEPLVTVQVFTAGANQAAATVVSDTAGLFDTGNIATGGVPLEGHLRASKALFRTTYLFPANPVLANALDVPVFMISAEGFTTLTGLAGVTQNDTNNGAIVAVVIDCSADGTPVAGSTLSVQQNGADVGELFDLGALLPQAAGTFFVFNVPDGPTQISATYNGMTFPVRTIASHKKAAGPTGAGTITATAVAPGP